MLAGKNFLYNTRALLQGRQWGTLFKFRREVSYYRKSLAIKLDWVARDTAKTENRVAACYAAILERFEFNLLIAVADRG